MEDKKEKEMEDKKEEEIEVSLSIDTSSEELKSLIDELNKDPDIQEVEAEDVLTGIGEAIMIAIIAGLAVDLVRKTPEGIKRFKELIQRILKKSEKHTKNKRKTKLTITIDFTDYEFTTSSKEDISEKVDEILEAI
ncbi:MAG: hypothetical protein ACXADA_24350 [Candidatus Hodarchaeales archaeon]|jgi:hypothetical protein